jgi:hypothetical protein
MSGDDVLHISVSQAGAAQGCGDGMATEGYGRDGGEGPLNRENGVRA